MAEEVTNSSDKSEVEVGGPRSDGIPSEEGVPAEITFKCLRCGYEFKGPYDRKVPQERACPKCGSNSVRPLPKK